MYKMKFINNKWNPTFSRNIQSSCSFRLSESCVLVNKVRLIQGLGERCLWAWKSMSSMLWASTIFFPLKTLPFLSTAACLDLNIFSLSHPFHSFMLQIAVSHGWATRAGVPEDTEHFTLRLLHPVPSRKGTLPLMPFPTSNFSPKRKTRLKFSELVRRKC